MPCPIKGVEGSGEVGRLASLTNAMIIKRMAAAIITMFLTSGSLEKYNFSVLFVGDNKHPNRFASYC